MAQRLTTALADLLNNQETYMIMSAYTLYDIKSLLTCQYVSRCMFIYGPKPFKYFSGDRCVFHRRIGHSVGKLFLFKQQEST